jgi:hypothetical protein
VLEQHSNALQDQQREQDSTEVADTKAMLTKFRMAIEIAEMRLGDPELFPRLDRLVDLRVFDISTHEIDISTHENFHDPRDEGRGSR